MNLRSSFLGLGLLGSALAANAAIVVQTTDITVDTTWLAANEYVLQSARTDGAIRVVPGVTLTIQAGTIVRGQPRSNVGLFDAGTLVVTRGAKIIANGTAGNPIIFTTASTDNDSDGIPDGFTRVGTPGAAGASVVASPYNVGTFVKFWDDAPKTAPKNATTTGLWGGVVVLGRAPVNAIPFTSPIPGVGVAAENTLATPYLYSLPVIEGLVSPDYEYGANWNATDVFPVGTPAAFSSNITTVPARGNFVDPDDNSGSITFVSIRHGGIQLSVDSEINGLSLGGVGRGTKVGFVEVWGNEDDGVEIFGGTVNLSNIAIFATKDDGLDIDEGWSGQIQFALVVGGSFQERLLELDGDNADESVSTSRAAKPNFEVRTAGELRNLTLIAGPSVNASTSAGEGIRTRRNWQAKIYNTLVANVIATRRPINSASTFWNVVRHVGFETGTAGNSFSTATENANLLSVAPGGLGISGTFAVGSIAGDTAGLQYPTALDVIPAGVPAVLANESIPAGQIPGFFQSAPYRGAFSNSAVSLWTSGWTAANKSGAL